MLATILFPIPLAVLSVAPLPHPTRDCQLEILSPSAIEEVALADFNAKVDLHVRLHRHLVRVSGAATILDDEGGFAGSELRAMLVAARPYGRPGDFFDAGAVTAFRARIDRALLRATAPASGRLYEPLPGEPPPAVNTAFPSVADATTWPALFIQLPQLPRELDYALWGRDLVLVDTAANLVLDVLPDALPEGAYSGAQYH